MTVSSENKKGNKPTKYLTKRLLISSVNRSLKLAAFEAMKRQGFNVIAENGYVVKVFADGKREVIKKLPVIDRPKNIVLK